MYPINAAFTLGNFYYSVKGMKFAESETTSQLLRSSENYLLQANVSAPET